ncbi:MAG: GNAT family N-acetyltransferase [Gammaproteobacteria bacterium]|nr:GNAT family N-acetyltransferase [Gammaproteobacteria bacterium]
MPQANRNHQLDGSVRNARFTDTGERRCPFYERPARGNPDCHIEILKATDLPPVVQLHEEIHASLRDSGVLYFRDIDFFERLLAGDEGGIVGARAGGRLIGYAAFKRAGGDCGSYHRHLNLPYTDPKLVAETAGSVVHSDFRNHGLHVALCRTRIDVVRSLGFRDLAAVVSVANPAGTATCFRCGLEVRALHYDADGTNLLFHARLVDNRSSGNPPVEHWIKLPDTAEHRAVLAAGFRGVVYHRKAGELQVGYASPPSKPPPQPNKPR